jgi:hypothetical protein
MDRRRGSSIIVGRRLSPTAAGAVRLRLRPEITHALVLAEHRREPGRAPPEPLLAVRFKPVAGPLSHTASTSLVALGDAGDDSRAQAGLHEEVARQLEREQAKVADGDRHTGAGVHRGWAAFLTLIIAATAGGSGHGSGNMPSSDGFACGDGGRRDASHDASPRPVGRTPSRRSFQVVRRKTHGTASSPTPSETGSSGLQAMPANLPRTSATLALRGASR